MVRNRRSKTCSYENKALSGYSFFRSIRKIVTQKIPNTTLMQYIIVNLIHCRRVRRRNLSAKG
ncbi:MAG: hypothetical protein LBK82_09975 [Planctomycetaceae bacterium]|nr:hypothetical protein [Planctomycetaceae bacterium]